jgi:hypothetical protein
MIAAAPLTSGSAGYADTLEVLLSRDCGRSYQSLYKKYNTSLNTGGSVASAFNPSGAEWRKDTVSLLNYINKGNIMLAFRITNYNQSNIYIDDVNVFTVTVNPNLKAKGFMVTPNPASGKINVQFYPAPDKLLAVQVYTVAGQLIKNIATGNGQSNLYTIDLSPHPAGIYVVRAVFPNQVLVKKIIKN